MSSVLVFSIALNGYQWRYRDLLKTHRQYCLRHGYQYVAVTRPVLSTLGLEVAWLKVKLILEALQAGYETVLFLDADTRVAADAPGLNVALNDQHLIYAAKGFSGRYNSGVLLIRNGSASIRFFEKMLAMALNKLPEADDVGWGENGHLIHLAKREPSCTELDPRWNNNHRLYLNDFIRHYSRGPLYHEHHASLSMQLMERLSHYTLALHRRLIALIYGRKANMQWQKSRFYPLLDQLCDRVCHRHPVFRNLHTA